RRRRATCRAENMCRLRGLIGCIVARPTSVWLPGCSGRSLALGYKYPSHLGRTIAGPPAYNQDTAMDIREAIKLALQSLWQNKMRTVLTLLGVMIGVASVIAVVTLVNGAN